MTFYDTMLVKMDENLKNQNLIEDNEAVSNYEEEKEVATPCGRGTCYLEGEYGIDYYIINNDTGDTRIVTTPGISFAELIQSFS